MKDLINIMIISLIIVSACSQTTISQGTSASNNNEPIKQALTEVVNDGKAPGIAAAIISGDGIIEIAAAGVRKSGSDIAFTRDDFVHLGSCTKAMTATMLATFVAEGSLSWESKLVEVIPELKERIHSDYHSITLWQLLTHRAGLTKNAMNWKAHRLKEIKARRLAILEDNFQKPVSYKDGEFHYSNLGYMIAACMAERISGLSWEALMKKRLFDLLEMATAGFGAPNTHNQIDQPWGHSRSGLKNKWQADQSDNAEALGPAGMIHCSIEDWAKFLSIFLCDENPVLDSIYVNKLTTPIGYYAGGWGIIKQEDQPWAKGKVLSHSGSNGIWFVTVLVAPKLNRAYLVATNSRDFGSTGYVCNDVIRKLLRLDLQTDKD